MSFRLALTLGACIFGLIGCSENAFYETAPVPHKRGPVKICYAPDKTDEEELRTMADEACQLSEKYARFHSTLRFGCAWTAPDVAIFTCESP